MPNYYSKSIYTCEEIKLFQSSSTCILCITHSVAICFYLHFLIICSAHSLPLPTFLNILWIKLSHNYRSIDGFRKIPAPHPDVRHTAAEEAAKQMKISSSSSPFPFKMTAGVPHVPAHLGHFHTTSCDSSLQLPGLLFCFHQIKTRGNRPSQIPFTAQLFTASNCAGQTPIRLNELQR